VSAKRVYTLTRTTQTSGNLYVVKVPNLREARKYVAWCMDDNAHLTRHEACVVSDRLVVGETLSAHGYSFVLVQS